MEIEKRWLEGVDMKPADRDFWFRPHHIPDSVNDANILRKGYCRYFVDNEVGVEACKLFEVVLVIHPPGYCINQKYIKAVFFQERSRVGKLKWERHIAAALVLKVRPA